MRSLQELVQNSDAIIKKNARKDALRRACVKEFTQRLNEERQRDNAAKITKYMWEKQATMREAIAVLKKKPDRRERIWPPYTERAIHFKTIHLDSQDLRDFLDQCNKAEKDRKSFGMTFNIGLKIQK